MIGWLGFGLRGGAAVATGSGSATSPDTACSGGGALGSASWHVAVDRALGRRATGGFLALTTPVTAAARGGGGLGRRAGVETGSGAGSETGVVAAGLGFSATRPRLARALRRDAGLRLRCCSGGGATVGAAVGSGDGSAWASGSP